VKVAKDCQYIPAIVDDMVVVAADVGCVVITSMCDEDADVVVVMPTDDNDDRVSGKQARNITRRTNAQRILTKCCTTG